MGSFLEVVDFVGLIIVVVMVVGLIAGFLADFGCLFLLRVSVVAPLFPPSTLLGLFVVGGFLLFRFLLSFW